MLLPTLVLLADLPAFQKAPSADGSRSSVLIERSLVQDRVEHDGALVRVITRTAFLRDPAGVAAFGQIGQAYIADHGEVAFEDVTIEKADGHRVPVSASAAEDINPFGMSGTVPSDFRFRRLTIPGLEPGDRLHFRTTQKTQSASR